jgi:hypothetical protein
MSYVEFHLVEASKLKPFLGLKIKLLWDGIENLQPGAGWWNMFNDILDRLNDTPYGFHPILDNQVQYVSRAPDMKITPRSVGSLL